MTAKVLENRLNISNLQANRYLDTLQRIGILYGNDRKRNRMYYFMELLDLMRRGLDDVDEVYLNFCHY